MIMAKDPAFLFYSSDFLTGTIIMPFEDRGKYITILAFMHQNGRLNEETIRLLVGSVSDNLKSKFGIDNKGFWFNDRLEEEIKKRSNFMESRRENGKKGGRPPKKGTILNNENNKPTHNLPEDVNEDEIVNENIIKNELKNKKNKLEKLILEKFGFTEQRHFPKHRFISDFFKVKILDESDLENFIDQFQSYYRYKELAEEKIHSFHGLFGKQENRFEDSALLSDNWRVKLENYQEFHKKKSNFEKNVNIFEQLKNKIKNGNSAL